MEERILVIDDAAENREFIADYILQPQGYIPLTAKDGREGLEMALKHRPDLILLDLQMPRMNGIDFLKAMAAEGLQTPVILMTFYGSEEIAVEVYRLGVRDYVKKPFSVDEMMMAVERSLGESRLRREKDALTERLIQSNRELRRRVQEMNTLYEVGKSVTSLTDMNQLLPRIVDAAIRLTQAEEGHLYLVENSGLVCRALKRHQQAKAGTVEISVKDDPVAKHVIDSRQPLVLTPEQLEKSPPLTVACAPLVFSNQVIGVLGVSNISSGAYIFTKHESALLSTLSDYAAIAIQNSRNFETQHQTKEREKSQIRSTFGRFVPPQVVDHVLSDPNNLQLGGTRQPITVFFADLRGYTAYSENLPPEQVIETLNGYLSLAANVILSYGGTLDKYLGDGLMGLFNAPDPQSDHIQRAVDAALTLQEAANRLSSERGDSLQFSIGLGTGEAVVGYIGTDTAINYTAIGDVVNVSKRLQEAARGGQILVGDDILNVLGDRADAQSLGELKVRGRQKGVRVYELYGLRKDVG